MISAPTKNGTHGKKKRTPMATVDMAFDRVDRKSVTEQKLDILRRVASDEYRSALPFVAHEHNTYLEGLDENSGFFDYAKFHSSLWEIADNMLAKGLCISMPVDVTRAAWLAAFVAQAVTCQVVADYDFDCKRLCVQAVKGDDVE